MKKVFFVLIFAAMTAICVEAQVFVGGSLGVDAGAGKRKSGSTTTNQPLTTSFEISPMAGYYLSDDFAVGLSVAFGYDFRNNRADQPTKRKTTRWELAPFVRYSLLNVGDFSVLAQGDIGISGNKTKTTQGSTTTDGPKNFIFEIGVMPLLSYSLTDRINLEASSNLARLSFESRTRKTGTGDSQVKEKETSFGFGVDALDFFSSPYQIGVIYKF